jgi:hypothetical protein
MANNNREKYKTVEALLDVFEKIWDHISSRLHKQFSGMIFVYSGSFGIRFHCAVSSLQSAKVLTINVLFFPKDPKDWLFMMYLMYSV